MRNSRILAKIKQNLPALATCAHLVDPSIFELIALMGFDGIWMDMEHHFYSLEKAAELMRASEPRKLPRSGAAAGAEGMRQTRIAKYSLRNVVLGREWGG